MNVYTLNILIILLFPVCSYFIKLDYAYKGIRVERDLSNTRICHIIFFCILFFEMAFVGDFLTDILNYYFNFYANYGELDDYSMRTILIMFFKNSSIGWILLNVIIKKIFKDYVILLIASSFIVSLGYTIFIKKNSELTWISMLVLLCGGTYYLGWNVVRQSIAASLFCLCFPYLCQGYFFKYCIAVFFIMSFHFSSIVLIPLYFLLRSKFTLKLGKNFLFILLIISLLIYFVTPSIFLYITKYAYTEYQNGGFGVDYGISRNTMIKYFLISGIVIINFRKFNLNNIKERVIYNGTILFFIFSIMSAKIFMLQRIIHFLMPFLILAYPIIINRSKNKTVAVLAVVTLFLGLHCNYLIDGNYYFFWNNIFLKWGTRYF